MSYYLVLSLIILFLFTVGNGSVETLNDLLEQRFQDIALLQDEMKVREFRVNEVQVTYWADVSGNPLKDTMIKDKLRKCGVKDMQVESTDYGGKITGKRRGVEVKAEWWQREDKQRIRIGFMGSVEEELREVAGEVLYYWKDNREFTVTASVHGSFVGSKAFPGSTSYVSGKYDTLKTLPGELTDKRTYRNSCHLLYYSPSLSHRGLNVADGKANWHLQLRRDQGGALAYSAGVPFLTEPAWQ